MVLPLIMSLLGMAPQLISAAGSIWQSLTGGQPQRGRQRAPSRRKYLTRRNVGIGVALGAVATAGYAAYRYQAGQSIGASAGVGFAGSPSFSVPGAAAPSGGYSSGGYTPTQQE